MITLEQFERVFGACEKLPKNKKDFIEKLYFFYKAGREAREKEIINSISILIKK